MSERAALRTQFRTPLALVARFLAVSGMFVSISGSVTMFFLMLVQYQFFALDHPFSFRQNSASAPPPNPSFVFAYVLSPFTLFSLSPKPNLEGSLLVFFAIGGVTSAGRKLSALRRVQSSLAVYLATSYFSTNVFRARTYFFLSSGVPSASTVL